MIKAECQTLHLMLTMFKICNMKIIRDKGKIGERIIECHNVVHEIYMTILNFVAGRSFSCVKHFISNNVEII